MNSYIPHAQDSIGTPRQFQDAQSRSFRVPSPPKVWIPPAPVDDTGLPDLSYIKKSPDDFAGCGFENMDFLQAMDYGSIERRDVGRDWRYEERREAQEILPYLYLGPDSAARNKEFLTKTGITLCLAVRNTQSAQAKFLNPKAPRDLGIPTVNIDVMHNPQLIAAFPRAIAAINEHMNARYQATQASTDEGHQNNTPPGKVLIFCETGNERSAAVAAAYTMAVYSIDVTRAIQLVQSARFCVALDYQMGHLLRSYQCILEAKRDVYSANNQMNTTQNGNNVAQSTETQTTASSKKRGVDDIRDEDAEMDDWQGEEMDAMRFRDRESHAPFEDIQELGYPKGNGFLT